MAKAVPLVKICGVKDVETARATAQAGADFIGLMFVENSARHVNPQVTVCTLLLCVMLSSSSTLASPMCRQL